MPSKSLLLVFLVWAVAVLGVAFGERVAQSKPQTKRSEKEEMEMAIELSQIDENVVVRLVFGQGAFSNTDSPNYAGSVGNPNGLDWEPTEEFVYTTDASGGSLVRKFIAITEVNKIDPTRYVGTKFNVTSNQVYFGVSTVFANVNWGVLSTLQISPDGHWLYGASIYSLNLRKVPIMHEASNGGDKAVNIAGYPSLNSPADGLIPCMKQFSTLKNFCAYPGPPSGLGSYVKFPFTNNDQASPDSNTATDHNLGTYSSNYDPAAYANFDGVGSYARFVGIMGFALQSEGVGTYAVDRAIFVMDEHLNAIRRIGLTQGAGGDWQKVTTWFKQLEPTNFLAPTGPQIKTGGITTSPDGLILYASVIGGIYKFDTDFTSPTCTGTCVPTFFVGIKNDAFTANTNNEYTGGLNARGWRDGSGFADAAALVAANPNGQVIGDTLRGPRFQDIVYMTVDDMGNLYISDIRTLYGGSNRR